MLLSVMSLLFPFFFFELSTTRCFCDSGTSISRNHALVSRLFCDGGCCRVVLQITKPGQAADPALAGQLVRLGHARQARRVVCANRNCRRRRAPFQNTAPPDVGRPRSSNQKRPGSAQTYDRVENYIFFFKVILAASSSPLPAQLPAMTETPPPPPPAVLSTPIKPWSLAVNWRPCPLGTVWKEGGGFTVNLDLPTTLPTRPRRPLARFTLDSSSLANPSLLRWHVGAQFQQQKQPQPSSELSSSASQPAAAAAAAPGATVPSPPPQQQQPQTPKSERRGSGSGSSSSSNVDVKRVRLW